MTYFEKVKFCNEYLLSVMPEMIGQARRVADELHSQRNLMRTLMNTCPPRELSEEFYAVQDEVLKEDLRAKGVVEINDMQERETGVYLWRGDITRIRAGAVVNAANSQMLGCFVPQHGCIDNAIHSAAGLQLRAECYNIMKAQGHDEHTGQAKITDAYNLPCEKVIHTVGPIVYGELKKKHCELLESCYRECFKLAVQNGLESIAYCCISTGEYKFPNEEAAKIAVRTVRELKQEHDVKVIFNVFMQEDLKFYDRLFR